MISRRAFVARLTRSLLAAPFFVETQSSVKVHQIGFLPSGASAAHRQQLEAALRKLKEGVP